MFIAQLQSRFIGNSKYPGKEFFIRVTAVRKRACAKLYGKPIQLTTKELQHQECR